MLSATALRASAEDNVAPTPPMGWNSWDAFGLTINEADYRANIDVMKALRPYGWTYAVIDEGWYMDNPFGDKLENRVYQLDGKGLLIPSAARYPSSANGAGLKPLADWVHQQGLKFGIHIVRGIPKHAVERDLPIADSNYRASDAADTVDMCSWDDGNYGVRDNAAGQAYYDSMMALYAIWGVDYLKVDCIADHPYKESEIRQIAAAIKKAGRPIVLSLSPGPSQLRHTIEFRRYSQLWRISNDIWDSWEFRPRSTPDGFPSGVVTAFDHLAKWNGWAGAGHWPDADMLPFGSLTPHPGWGEPRQTRLTHDEVRTQFTLWSIGRSPLILGANLTKLDDFTRSIITNKEVIAINQTAWESHPVADLPSEFANAQVWHALAGPRKKPTEYVAFFNVGEVPITLNATWKQLGVHQFKSMRELWTGVRTPASGGRIKVTLPAHATALYRVE